MTKRVHSEVAVANGGERAHCSAARRWADSRRAFDVQKVRATSRSSRTTVHGKPLVYLDNGATTQKPQAVIDAIDRYYESQNANIHRGVYELSQTATSCTSRRG